METLKSSSLGRRAVPLPDPRKGKAEGHKWSLFCLLLRVINDGFVRPTPTHQATIFVGNWSRMTEDREGGDTDHENKRIVSRQHICVRRPLPTSSRPLSMYPVQWVNEIPKVQSKVNDKWPFLVCFHFLWVCPFIWAPRDQAAEVVGP